MRIGSCIIFLVLTAVFGGAQLACGQAGNMAAVNAATPLPTPSKSITAADVAKLKWIEGTWSGMGGDTQFFERYHLDGTSLVVEGFTDATLTKVTDTEAFALKDGEFGKGDGGSRSAASFISEDAIQFAPAVAGRGNYFRFERHPDGTWNAVLEWPATADKPARTKTYKMQRYSAAVPKQ